MGESVGAATSAGIPEEGPGEGSKVDAKDPGVLGEGGVLGKASESSGVGDVLGEAPGEAGVCEVLGLSVGGASEDDPPDAGDSEVESGGDEVWK